MANKVKKNSILWLGWFVMSGILSSYYAYGLVGNDKTVYLPGATSSGHYQVEITCQVCHEEGFGGLDSLQKACMNCHGKELKAVDDSHPKSKFTDPRNADRVAILDARYCVTCHKEHVPDRTREMGVTLPDDFCAYCHQDIEKDRPSHKGMAFDTCADAGCHNFHDNKALYEDFLVKHGRDHEVVQKNPTVLARDFIEFYKKEIETEELKNLSAEDAKFPANLHVVNQVILDWATSSHAYASVNCMDCHAKKIDARSTSAWLDKPPASNCKSCHEMEVKTYFDGKHGMRIARNISPMNTVLARQILRKDIKDKDLDCNSCHGAHGFDTSIAAIKSCIACHDDEHTKAFKSSPHYRLWQQAQLDRIPREQGVSCATCHLPREAIRHKGQNRILVVHNQNHNLRPNEKMIREVCMNCHSLEYSIDALADSALVKNNFNGAPEKRIASIEMALKREKVKATEKKAKDK